MDGLTIHGIFFVLFLYNFHKKDVFGHVSMPQESRTYKHCKKSEYSPIYAKMLTESKQHIPEKSPMNYFFTVFSRTIIFYSEGCMLQCRPSCTMHRKEDISVIQVIFGCVLDILTKKKTFPWALPIMYRT